MTTTPYVSLEAMDVNDVWQDYTTSLQGGDYYLGFPRQRAPLCSVGKATFNLVNPTQLLTPSSKGWGNDLLAIGRRIRVKWSGTGQGKALQTIHRGAYGLGGVTTITATGLNLPIGNNGGVTSRQAQSFQVAPGQLTQITFRLAANVGTPTGNINWEVRTALNLLSGSLLNSGVIAPTASATNTITVSGGVGLGAGTYWLILYPDAQTSGNYWQWQAQSTSTYANGNTASSTDGGSTWTQQATQDAQCSITTSLINNYWRIENVTNTFVIGDVFVLTFVARAAFDSQYNTIVAQCVTSAETQTPQSFTLTNKWATYTLTFTATANGTTIEPRFLDQFTGMGAFGTNSTAIEYQSMTLKKNGGANLLTNGTFLTTGSTTWAKNDIGGSALATETLTVIDDYLIKFNGLITKVSAHPHATAGDLLTVVNASGMVSLLQKQKVSVPLQKGRTADQILNTLMALLPTSTSSIIPGKSFQVGGQTFQVGFDGFTKNAVFIIDAMQAAIVSEFGRGWEDCDGTMRMWNYQGVVKQAVAGTKLTLTNQQYEIVEVASDEDSLSNDVILTYHPRNVGTGVVVLGSTPEQMKVGPKWVNSSNTKTFTLTYRDQTTGKVIGGDTVLELVPSTDYTIWDHDQGGVNLTNSPTVSVTSVRNASQAEVTVTNNNPFPVYIRAPQVRGFPVTQYDPLQVEVQDTGSQSLYHVVNSYPKDLPFTNDQTFVESLAQYILSQYAAPYLEARTVRFDYTTTLANVDLMTCEMMDVVALTDAQSGLLITKHIIIGQHVTIAANGMIERIEFTQERIDSAQYWLLGIAGFSELGQTTYLYI